MKLKSIQHPQEVDRNKGRPLFAVVGVSLAPVAECGGEQKPKTQKVSQNWY
jgi:hypothetical protein